MLQDPTQVRVRWVELSDLDVDLVSELARRLSTDEACVAPSAMDVSRTLVKRVRDLPLWTTRTQSLSKEAATLRDLARTSHDPNQLLFKDLPRGLGGRQTEQGAPLASAVDGALRELEAAYPAMLRRLAETLLSELRIKAEAKDLGPLHRRAAAIIGVSGNFRLDALATRLKTFGAVLEEIEGIASLAANKPSRDWVDRDVDAARVELAALAQQFLRVEGLCHLKGRTDGRTTLAVFISDPDFPEPASPEFELDVDEHRHATQLAQKLAELIGREGASRQVALGAVAKLGLSLSSLDPKAVVPLEHV